MNYRTKSRIKSALFVLFVVVVCAGIWLRMRTLGPGREGLGRSFEFDLDAHLVVDPELVGYREAASLHPGLTAVSSLAVGPAGQIYVGGDRSVVVLDAAGVEQRRFAVDGSPACMAVALDGGVYVGVGNHIEQFDAAGHRVASWEPVAADALLVSIVLRGDEVYVGEARGGQILRYDRDGVLVGSIQGFVLFSSPILGMDVAADGRLWVANPGARELRRYGPAGSVDLQWSRSGRTIDAFSGCCNPVDIALRPDGNIVTSEKNIVRVKVVDPAGALVTVVAGPDAFSQEITQLDIAVDPDGRVLVLDPVRMVVRVFVETTP